MKKITTIELNEEDVNLAIKEFVEKSYDVKIVNMVFNTKLSGSYDEGNARDFVESVICNCE